MLAINVAAFCRSAAFLQTIQGHIAHLKSVQLSTGTTEIQLRDNLEGRTRRERLRDGIPVEESTWMQVQQSANRFSVTSPAV